MTNPDLIQPPPWCACCLEHRVAGHGSYFCPVCVPANPTPKFPGPPSRMALDLPIATTSGDL